MESADLLALIGLIPPAYAPYVAGFCELVFAFSVLALGVKKLLGEPSPDDGPYRRAFFWCAKWLDVLAVNTATVRQKYRTTELQEQFKVLASQPDGYSPEHEDAQ